jgi:hypothetical protein
LASNQRGFDDLGHTDNVIKGVPDYGQVHVILVQILLGSRIQPQKQEVKVKKKCLFSEIGWHYLLKKSMVQVKG